MTFVLGTLLIAVVDLLSLNDEATRADNAAYLGAQAGATSIDPAQMAAGVTSSAQLRLGPEAQSSCRQAAQVADPQIEVRCIVDGSTIDVVVTKSIRLPVPFFGVGSSVRAERHAGAALGTVQPS
ncbi:MAG TPA: hypothetical protein VFO60_05005 [Candidatus Dormibacteraeota bacterium]|nr:hypothetical protein [Candidatus Dormibacteraeota bacterium]